MKSSYDVIIWHQHIAPPGPSPPPPNASCPLDTRTNDGRRRNVGVASVSKVYTLAGQEDQLKEVLGNQDCSTHYSYAATVAIDAGDPNFQLYHSGVYTSDTCLTDATVSRPRREPLRFNSKQSPPG